MHMAMLWKSGKRHFDDVFGAANDFCLNFYARFFAVPFTPQGKRDRVQIDDTQPKASHGKIKSGAMGLPQRNGPQKAAKAFKPLLISQSTYIFHGDIPLTNLTSVCIVIGGLFPQRRQHVNGAGPTE